MWTPDVGGPHIRTIARHKSLLSSVLAAAVSANPNGRQFTSCKISNSHKHIARVRIFSNFEVITVSKPSNINAKKKH